MTCGPDERFRSNEPYGSDNTEGAGFHCGPVGVNDILPLRARELRAGKPMDSARFPEDNDEHTLHFAAWSENTVIGCLTLIGNTGKKIPSWQLRGMATDRNWQQKGIGRALLNFSENRLREYCLAHFGNPEVRIWCNARTGAVPFYKGMGYKVISDEFMIQKVGLHYKMEKNIL